MFCFGIGRRLRLLKQEMKNIGLESGRLPPARLTGVCLGGQAEGLLPSPLTALLDFDQVGAECLGAASAMAGEGPLERKPFSWLR